MNGFNISEAGHTVLAITPQALTNGTITSQAFSMKAAEHASIIIAFGDASSPPVSPSSIKVKVCTSAAGANAVDLQNFRYYYQTLGGAGNDILDGYQQCLANSPNLPPNFTSGAAGIATFPASVADLVFQIEIDSAELEAVVDAVGSQTEHPYVQVLIAAGGVGGNVVALAVLSGVRYQYKVGATATT